MNLAFEKITGWLRSEWLGKHFGNIIHPDDLPLAIKTFQKALQGETPPPYELRILSRSGEYLIGEFTTTPQYKNGKVVGEFGIARDITERKQAEEKIYTYQEQLRSLASELSLIEERERRRIATELHDHISQSLAIAKLRLGSLRELISSVDFVGSLDEIHELIDQTVQYTRSLTFELSPPILYELGLEPALEWLAEQIQEKHGILVNFEDDRQPKPMSEEIRISLFKSVRELLINIVKHAKANQVKVSIRREDNNIQITVEDDGIGFSPSEDKQLGKIPGYGLFSIHERLKYLGGFLEIESKPGQGTRVTLVAPLEKKENNTRSVT